MIRAFVFGAAFLLCGCGMNHYFVKENLTEEQLVDLAVVRKPTDKRTLGLLPVYQDYLEGYIRGGVVEAGGQRLEGVTVKVTDQDGNELPEFSPGVSDRDGFFRIRFSLPVRWRHIDFTAYLTAGAWKTVTPRTEFRIYFNRDTGVLSFNPKETWVALKSEAVPPPALPPAKPGKKSNDDFMGGFDFGP